MKNRLPTPILRRPKQGFSIPLKHWLRKELRPLLLDVLTPDTIRRRGYFEEETVTRWITEHMQGRVNHSHRLWALLLLELWQQANSDSAVATYAHVSPLAAARHVG
jgi:asparagine synthase (glutamine-hydrolysing)